MRNDTWKPWSASDDQFLRDNYKTKTQKQLAVLLRRTVTAVGTRVVNLGLSKQKQWTKEEDEYLLSQKNIAKCARNLGRTIRSVQKRATKLLLRYRRSPLTNDERRLICELNSRGLSNSEIADQLNPKSNPETIRRELRRLGIPTPAPKPCKPTIATNPLIALPAQKRRGRRPSAQTTPCISEPLPPRKPPKNIFEAVVNNDAEEFEPRKEPEEAAWAMPGSREKIELMRARAERGEHLTTEKDRSIKPLCGYRDVAEALATDRPTPVSQVSSDDDEEDESSLPPKKRCGSWRRKRVRPLT